MNSTDVFTSEFRPVCLYAESPRCHRQMLQLLLGCEVVLYSLLLCRQSVPTSAAVNSAAKLCKQHCDAEAIPTCRLLQFKALVRLPRIGAGLRGDRILTPKGKPTTTMQSTDACGLRLSALGLHGDHGCAFASVVIHLYTAAKNKPGRRQR